MQQIGEPDLEAFWEKLKFTQDQAKSGADFILDRWSIELSAKLALSFIVELA